MRRNYTEKDHFTAKGQTWWTATKAQKLRIGKERIHSLLFITCTRQHSIDLLCKKFKQTKGKTSCTKHVRALGDSLPQDVVKDKRIKGFQKVLEKFVEHGFIKGS